MIGCVVAIRGGYHTDNLFRHPRIAVDAVVQMVCQCAAANDQRPSVGLLRDHVPLYQPEPEMEADLGEITQYKEQQHHRPGVGFGIFGDKRQQEQEGEGTAPCLEKLEGLFRHRTVMTVDVHPVIDHRHATQQSQGKYDVVRGQLAMEQEGQGEN